MIVGHVVGAEAIVSLTIHGPGGWYHEEVRAVVDAGFMGWLTLPRSLANLLVLPEETSVSLRLADGNVTVLPVYLAAVDWHGEDREILVYELPGIPLVGMKLLSGSRLTIDAIEGGPVTVAPIT